MGSKKQTILVLNGHRYDALTGEAVGGDAALAAVKPISDMIHSSALKPISVPSHQAVKLEPLTTSTGQKLMDVSRSTGHTKPRQPQRANTLVRSAVTPPRPGFRSQTKVSAPTTAIATPLTSIAPKWPFTQVNPTRLNRAEHIAKSEAISKFASGSSVPEQIQDAAVRIDKPLAVQSPNTELPQDSDDLFERAIASAESHTQKPVDQKKLGRQARKQAKSAAKATKRPIHHHLASVVAASLAVLIIGGFVGLQNKDTITLRFANAQAGFQASLPTYEPTGYGVGSFNYSAGTVGTTFHNSATNRDYSLTQQTTKWDSQDLLDNSVSVNHKDYQALQSGDLVIYIYGKNDASWVKNGIWYQLKSDGNLSTSQVLNIAASV